MLPPRPLRVTVAPAEITVPADSQPGIPPHAGSPPHSFAITNVPTPFGFKK